MTNSGPSRQRLTMDDIARLAGVDKSTVSRALAGNPIVAAETRDHVRRVAEQHGYILNAMASGLRSRRTKVIAVVIPLAHDIRQPVSDPFFMEMVAHLADRLGERGYDLLLSKIATPNAAWLETLPHSRRADGVILIGQSLEHAQISAAAAGGVPLAVWGARLDEQNYTTVGTDNRAGGLLATRHLIERGRRRIAFVGDRRLPEIAQRYEGYVAALRAAGLTPDPDLVISTQFEAEDALIAVTGLLDAVSTLDGIVAASDVIAMAAIQALSARGLRVPADVSVTGFDDILLAAHTSPPLTTIRQDIAQGAILLTDRILASVEKQPAPSIEMTPELIVRGSS